MLDAGALGPRLDLLFCGPFPAVALNVKPICLLPSVLAWPRLNNPDLGYFSFLSLPQKITTKSMA